MDALVAMVFFGWQWWEDDEETERWATLHPPNAPDSLGRHIVDFPTVPLNDSWMAYRIPDYSTCPKEVTFLKEELLAQGCLYGILRYNTNYCTAWIARQPKSIDGFDSDDEWIVPYKAAGDTEELAFCRAALLMAKAEVLK
jgi:hypothetical protein